MLRRGMTVLLFFGALALWAGFYSILIVTDKPIAADSSGAPVKHNAVYDFFCGRGWYQHGSLVMFFYGLLLVGGRYRRLRQESGALNLTFASKTVTPEDATAMAEKLPSRYRGTLLGRRLSNLLRGYSRQEEVGPLLDRLSENDREELERNTSLLSWVRGLPPVFGLLGTLDGLRGGTAEISRINSANDVESLRKALQDFAQNSSTAFDTTLLGISCAVLISAGIFLLRKSEDDLLARVDEVAHALARRFARKSPHDEDAHGVARVLEAALKNAAGQIMQAFQQEMREGMTATVRGWLETWKGELAATTRQILDQMRARSDSPEALVQNARAAVSRLEAIERALERPRPVQIKVSADANGREALA